ncbi:MAG: iron-sulfur cluster assembly scaffold protein [Deltaproteobacteria bacterium]|nr:iron-sulfur cluster assembly scaffold protein [Deltaproteobacteria bacterium]
MHGSRSTRPLSGSIPRPDGEAERSNSCGDTIRIQVRLDNGVVSEAACTVHGCTVALACARAATALARGKTPADVLRRMTASSLIEVLEDLPDDHEHMAEMAAETLHGAVEDALLNSREEWKKLYRT